MEQSAANEAGKDLVGQRNRADIPCARRVSLVAIGDSVTSAHIQTGFGDNCAHTTSDTTRRLRGNDGRTSYAGQYVDRLNGDVVRYYNVARTGFDTALMRQVAANNTDACGQPWARNAAPIELLFGAVRQARHAGDHVYAVGTAGANDTNWVKIIENALTCRALQYVDSKVPAALARLVWSTPTEEMPANLIPDGGACIFLTTVAGEDLRLRFEVPAYNGPMKLGQVTENVRAMTDAMLRAGADKVVWMSYHDISPAQIDIAGYIEALVRARLPENVRNELPHLDAHLVHLIDQRFAGAVQTMINGMNSAVSAGLPDDDKVTMADPAVGAGGIQVTMIGGSPHPNQAGHGQLAQELKETLDDL